MILYCDCFSGISGDMFLGGLIDLGVPIDYLQTELNKLKVPFQLQTKITSKKSIRAVNVWVVDPEENLHHHHHHHHRPAKELIHVLQESDLSPSIKEKSISMIWKIAQAEGKIHNEKPENVYLHEVGGIDTLVDICGALIGLDYLQIHQVFASIIPTGYGFIIAAHGQLPIPAPATLELLKGIPITCGQTPHELTTPTGAAIIANITDEFGQFPTMTVEKIGYGAGDHDFDVPNVLRLVLGQHPASIKNETNILLETNLDDMSPQIVEYVSNKLFETGALDVFTTPIFMKKQRPAFQLSVIVSLDNLEKVRNVLFQETTTLGLREIAVNKICLPREDRMVETIWGQAKVKMSRFQNGLKITPEYEDCKQIAQKNQIPLRDVIQTVQKEAMEVLRHSQASRHG